MKHIYLLLMLLLCSFGKAQLNLVTNGSFDDNPSCSHNFSTLPSWDRLAGHPEAFIFCQSNDSFQHPQNYWGFQVPEESDGYIGLKIYDPADSSRDYVGTILSSPIVPGDSIRVRIAITHADSSDWASSGLGILFCNGAYRNTVPYSTHTGANAFIASPFSEDVLWGELFYTFVSDTTYDRIELGNFFPNDSITVSASGTKPINQALYFIDNVRVQRYITTGVREPELHLHTFGSFINEIGQPCDESYYGMRIGTCACGESRRFLNIQ